MVAYDFGIVPALWHGSLWHALTGRCESDAESLRAEIERV